VPTRYTPTTLVARDPSGLAAFYTAVFDCVQTGPPRALGGESLERGMGLAGARVRGLHLRLPGHGDDGPTLELFALDELEPAVPRVVNRPGLMHLAFSVDDVRATLDRLVAAGGEAVGEIAEVEVAGVGTAGFVYARDPEGNIVELQEWK